MVLLTGASTSFGHTTELVREARPRLHIEAVDRPGGPLALRDRRRAPGRGGGALPDPRRPAPGDDPPGAGPPDERGAGGPPGHVHGQHGGRLQGAGPARGAGDSPERRRGRRHHGRALRRQDRHRHHEPAGGHRGDPAGPGHRRRRAAWPAPAPPRRPTRTPSTGPSWPPRGSATPSTGVPPVTARLLQALRSADPADRGRDRAGRPARPGGEGGGAPRRRGLRALAPGHRGARGPRQRVRRQGVPDAGRGQGARGAAPPACSGW